MTTITYTFGDVYTGAIIAELPLNSVSMVRNLDGDEFRANLYLDRTGFDNDVVTTATIPGRCYVVMERDGVIIGDFIIRSRTYQSEGKNLQLYGNGWKNYPEYRLITTDYSQTKEQLNIFTDLYYNMQSATNSAKVTIPALDSYPTLVSKTLDVIGSEYKTYRQAMDALADADDGFDWLISTSRTGGVYARTLTTGYPTLGAVAGNNVTIFEYPGNIYNYWQTDGMNGSGTHFYGIGAGEGTSMLVSTVTYEDLLSAGFPRYDVALSYKDVADQNNLNGKTLAKAVINKAPISVIIVELLGKEEPIFGSYGLGDACEVIITDARHPTTFKKVTRIYGWEYYPPDSENVETVRITLEGDE